MSINHGDHGNKNRKFLDKKFKGIVVPNGFTILASAVPLRLPMRINLRDRAKTPIYNQGYLGSCTANAIASAYSIKNMLKTRKLVLLSRLFIYYNELVLQTPAGQPIEDNGAYISDGMIVMRTKGSCVETLWPYYIYKFNIKPPARAYTDAKKHGASELGTQLNPSYVTSFKNAIYLGHPVIFGINVYSSFVSDAVAISGIVPYPNIYTEKYQGGHALVAVGYDDNLYGGVFIVQNSWGLSWGIRGICYIPYNYIDDITLTGDCHALTNTEIRLK